MTLNGYYKGLNDDTSWHEHGPEGNDYSIKQLSKNNILLFGRKTYEVMESFWPTEMAKELYPEVARKMNSAEKLVVSSSLKKAKWNNTKLISGDVMAVLKKIKAESTKDIAVLGSGNLSLQLMEAGLIDEMELMVDPNFIGQGTTVMGSIDKTIKLKLLDCSTFKNGTVILKYKVGRR